RFSMDARVECDYKKATVKRSYSAVASAPAKIADRKDSSSEGSGSPENEMVSEDGEISATGKDDDTSREEGISVENAANKGLKSEGTTVKNFPDDSSKSEGSSVDNARDKGAKSEGSSGENVPDRGSQPEGTTVKNSRDNGSNSEKASAENSSREKTPEKKNPGAKMGTTFEGRPGSGNVRNGRNGYGRGKRDNAPTDPDLIFGRQSPEDIAVPMSSIVSEIYDVTVRGKIFFTEDRELFSGKHLFTFMITDFTESLSAKIFMDPEEAPDVVKLFNTGDFVKVRGSVTIDRFENELTLNPVKGVKKIPSFEKFREDKAQVKRVELHCHTKMSEMDGVTNVKDLVKRAYKWGMRALAITDHGVVQAFPDAYHTVCDLYKKECDRRKEAGEPPLEKEDFFKIIYGVEAYLVDDLMDIAPSGDQPFEEGKYVVFDIETTGLSESEDRIIEIGAVKMDGFRVVDRYNTFVNPERPIPYEIEALTGITDEMTVNARTIEEVLPEFLEFCEDRILVGHNVKFDYSFIRKNMERLGIEGEFRIADTMGLARDILPGMNKYTLDRVAKALKISLENHHRAVDDAECTARIFVDLLKKYKEIGIDDYDSVNAHAKETGNVVRYTGKTFHTIILAANETGRVNLYKLVTMSHLKYFRSRPRIPKTELIKHREGLIIGSACVAGELYQALLDNAGDETLARIAGFYDYLEIQPLGNNAFLIDSDKYPKISGEKDIQDLNKKIVELGEKLEKPVVATCDVHFMDPEDYIYRQIIMSGAKFDDAEDPAPLFLRTTDEMLEEFEYLGRRKAEEIVITNTNKICDMVECISPVRPDKCPPVIPDSDNELREICYNKAHSLYGEEIPQVVEERLNTELDAIISNGYAVMYIIAQKLVWKSVEDGYLVGSRGSVGSSLTAYMAGITEVNSLPPHYLCPECKYSDFDSDTVREYSDSVGIDMPDRVCPKCGAKLMKMGFNIPFQTFLGFSGNKEPDIDLNFSSEYQSKAHKYTEVIFGKGQTFKAGTVSTVAEKTALGFVRNYFKDRQEIKRNAEIKRLSFGVTDVRRSTGQHPGGIVVLPVGEDINTFTPVQYPANKREKGVITTHFDYHSIDHNLLKLDILGHDDPTMVKMLQDLTGVDPVSIPLDDEKVLSLFSAPDALGVSKKDIACETGTLGIPEFGTDIVIDVLSKAQPETFTDLVRISGLTHGTGVWKGNAESLVESGKHLSDCICCRDDIMVYLISKGMESELSFKTMESVRKGKGLTPEMEQAMIAAQVPDWYIDSCKKIQYMFPKAHAAAYVMMGCRVAWYKVYRPLEYYAAYFSIRAKNFNYEHMCMGKGKMLSIMAGYERRKDSRDNKLTDQEDNEYRDMLLVREMFKR
ncbi:MAG: PolC-type DNA polymerase III, partial [Lachnospiraceae bacterium]|nr:PolC-type DNA polymerase III [Lachnospiraceae bacterium]